jgi:hypothetical protein
MLSRLKTMKPCSRGTVRQRCHGKRLPHLEVGLARESLTWSSQMIEDPQQPGSMRSIFAIDLNDRYL